MTVKHLLLTTAFAAGLATSAMAQTPIPVGPSALMGVAIGSEAKPAIAALKAKLGPGDDSGWVAGCEFNGIDERFITWGGLTVYFEEAERGRVLVNWSYALDFETGGARPGGPLPTQIKLPNGIAMGSNFAQAVRSYGGTPEVDDVFGVGIYDGNGFSLMTKDEDLNGPINEVAVPYFTYCE